MLASLQVIALIVTPEGFPLPYEVLPGNTADSTTLPQFLDHIEARYGRAQRVWVMDRGIPTEKHLAAMQMLDVDFPTTDGRELIFTRYTEPEADQRLLLAQLDWTLPPQPPPRITAKTALVDVVQTF